MRLRLLRDVVACGLSRGVRDCLWRLARLGSGFRAPWTLYWTIGVRRLIYTVDGVALAFG